MTATQTDKFIYADVNGVKTAYTAEFVADDTSPSYGAGRFVTWEIDDGISSIVDILEFDISWLEQRCRRKRVPHKSLIWGGYVFSPEFLTLAFELYDRCRAAI